MSIKTLIQRHPVAAYFGIAFLISWGSGLVVLGPKLIRHDIHPLDALFLFPILVIGVALTGVLLAAIVDGRSGVQNLFARIGLWRVGILIVWIYSNTGSLLLAQLMHVSSTGSLVILSPPRVSPAQEALWYAVYAAVLWIVVAIIATKYGKRLTW